MEENLYDIIGVEIGERRQIRAYTKLNKIKILFNIGEGKTRFIGVDPVLD